MNEVLMYTCAVHCVTMIGLIGHSCTQYFSSRSAFLDCHRPDVMKSWTHLGNVPTATGMEEGTPCKPGLTLRVRWVNILDM